MQSSLGWSPKNLAGSPNPASLAASPDSHNLPSFSDPSPGEHPWNPLMNKNTIRIVGVWGHRCGIKWYKLICFIHGSSSKKNMDNLIGFEIHPHHEKQTKGPQFHPNRFQSAGKKQEHG